MTLDATLRHYTHFTITPESAIIVMGKAIGRIEKLRGFRSMIKQALLIAIFIIMCLLMAGCSADKASTGWNVVRQASWNTHFHDVYFINKQNGWAA